MAILSDSDFGAMDGFVDRIRSTARVAASGVGFGSVVVDMMAEWSSRFLILD